MIINENLDSNSDSCEINEVEEGNPAMADAMRKVLNIGKNSSAPSVILAKAKILTKGAKKKNVVSSVIKEELAYEDIKDVKAIVNLQKRKRIKKQEVAALGRLKPSLLDREKEKPLVKISTRGVVQLFNAVREQQKIITKKMDEVGPSIAKQEKVLKSIDKRGFLDVLRGCKSTSTTTIPEDEVKTEDEEGNNEPSWDVLRDDFMMGAKLKDWDKKEKSKDLDNEPTKRPKKQRTKWNLVEIYPQKENATFGCNVLLSMCEGAGYKKFTQSQLKTS